MPNHITTILELSGDAQDIKKFKNENRGKEDISFSFEASYPTPSEEECLKETKSLLGGSFTFPGWYRWRVDFWGTKWDCYDVGNWQNNTIGYLTAWSPATAYYKHVSKYYPDITFKHTFADEGCGFIGYEIIQNGTVNEKSGPDWESKEGVELQKFLGVYFEDEG